MCVSVLLISIRNTIFAFLQVHEQLETKLFVLLASLTAYCQKLKRHKTEQDLICIKISEKSRGTDMNQQLYTILPAANPAPHSQPPCFEAGAAVPCKVTHHHHSRKDSPGSSISATVQLSVIAGIQITVK